jgi:hypothetical protein
MKRNRQYKMGGITIAAVLIFIVCGHNIDKKKFQGVERAAEALNSATSVGVNYLQFMQMQQNLALEIALVKKDDPSDEELKLINAYSMILGAYQASLIIWKGKIENNSWANIERKLQPYSEAYGFQSCFDEVKDNYQYDKKIEFAQLYFWHWAGLMSEESGLSLLCQDVIGAKKYLHTLTCVSALSDMNSRYK